MGKVKYIFKSLISNRAIVEGRHNPWYFAVIFFILGIVLTWIPSIHTGYTQYGAAFITNVQNNEVDRGIKYMMQQEYFQRGVFIRQEGDDYVFDYKETDMDAEPVLDQYARDDTWQNEYDGVEAPAEKPLIKAEFEDTSDSFPHNQVEPTNSKHTYYFDAVAVDTSDLINQSENTTSTSSDYYEDNSQRSVVLEIYLLPEISLVASDTVSEEIATTNNHYLSNFISYVVLGAEANGNTKFSHSYIIFTRDTINIAVAPLRGVKGGSYVSASAGLVSDACKAYDPTDGSTFYSLLQAEASDDSINSLYTAFADFFNESVKPSTIYSGWLNVALLTGVAVGLELISALAIFLFHRRKSSIYHDVNFWTATKESVTMAFTPCLLAMIFGFLLGQLSYTLVILVAGILLRLVFMNSKICPPQIRNDSNKPLYQARS